MLAVSTPTLLAGAAGATAIPGGERRGNETAERAGAEGIGVARGSGGLSGFLISGRGGEGV